MVSCILLHLSVKLIVTIIFMLIPLSAPLYFNLTSFTPNDGDIIIYDSAYPSSGAIQLTRNQQDIGAQGSVGRATYAQPLHLWDMASRNLTDFSTNFSFVINSRNLTWYGDGFAFFLAPNGSSRIPENATGGGSFGLTTDISYLNSTDNPFVAVEFDTFPNSWDPPNEHVGIDINSVRSVANTTWFSQVSIMEGLRHEVSISYDSQSMNLSVIFTGYRDNTTLITQTLSHVVDLREHLPEFVNFGFSAATGSSFALHTIYSWSFNSTLLLNGSETDPRIVIPGRSSRDGNTGLVIGLAVGGVVLLFILCLVMYILWNKRKGMIDENDETFEVVIGDEFERGNGPKKFAYGDLKRATNNFALQDKLGEGGFGGVYKGFVKETDSYVAVKRVSKGSMQGIKEYASEVRIISRLRHRNLVQLLGWCHEKHELLLVYEFLSTGSLDSHLFKGKSLLDWEIRFKIAQGLASALLYLHEEWEQCVVHRDIKSSNVMLDSNFNVKLGDFGLARLVDHEKGSQTTILAGTMGYMAPECMVTGKSSKETDVFSFGVVALEIASGRRSIDHKAEESRVNLVELAWSLYGTGDLLQLADPRLCGEFNSREMEQLMIVGLWCAHPDNKLRPSIRQVVLLLSFEAPLPVLPLKMPVPIYYTPGDMTSSPFESIVSISSQIVSSDDTESSECMTSSSGYSASSALLYSK